MSSSQPKQHMSDELNSAIKMLGDSWVLCIVCNLAEHNLRFSELERAIRGINPVTLTRRLKELEAEKLVKREEETVDKLSVVYTLTEKGQAVVPVIKEINKFAERFFS